MERILRSTPNGVLTAHTCTEWVPGVQLRHFSTTCAVHIEDYEGWWLSGCRSSVESTGGSSQVSWVQFSATAGLSTFLYFHLITSTCKFLLFQREARVLSKVQVCYGWIFFFFQAMLLHQQREERRKARLVQVRKQERAFAQRVRDEVKIKREEEKKLLEEHLQVIWQPWNSHQVFITRALAHISMCVQLCTSVCIVMQCGTFPFCSIAFVWMVGKVHVNEACMGIWCTMWDIWCRMISTYYQVRSTHIPTIGIWVFLVGSGHTRLADSSTFLTCACWWFLSYIQYVALPSYTSFVSITCPASCHLQPALPYCKYKKLDRSLRTKGNPTPQILRIF